MKNGAVTVKAFVFTVQFILMKEGKNIISTFRLRIRNYYQFR